jgi:hypothetical protein
MAFERYDNPPEHVFFRLLEPFSKNGGYKSECPYCEDKGVLLFSRDQTTGELLPTDRCSLCGQLFIYDDFEFVKKTGGR